MHGERIFIHKYNSLPATEIFFLPDLLEAIILRVIRS